MHNVLILRGDTVITPPAGESEATSQGPGEVEGEDFGGDHTESDRVRKMMVEACVANLSKST